ncbi:hypothetical protein ACR91C_26475, partial [Klebsiella pneumoniae]
TQPATGETYPKSDLFNKAGIGNKPPENPPETRRLCFYGMHEYARKHIGVSLDIGNFCTLSALFNQY